MNNSDDLRLIEDYLPIEGISAEASREKSVRKGHISTLHLWWARRPLVACRAAVYGALVPADRWVQDVELKAAPTDAAKAENVKNGKKKGLNRKAAKEFVTKLCRYPKTNPTKPEDIRIKRETEAAIAEAQRHILDAHAERLTSELAEGRKADKPPAWVDEFKFTGDKVTYDDIVAGRAPRPRVLDMFAGGGTIPFEALRLGCEAYALDLNPVAHITQLCTLVYPQKYGKPDPNARGMTGAKNAKGESTWGGLTEEVRYWGYWVLDRVRKEIGDLYSPIADPEIWATPSEVEFDHEAGRWNITTPGTVKRGVKLEETCPTRARALLSPTDNQDEEEVTNEGETIPLPPGFLQPVAYIWTRTVRCKNPSCGATIPMVKQTWLRRRPGDMVALRLLPTAAGTVKFKVVKGATPKDIGFDPSLGSTGGVTTCPFCAAVSDNAYLKEQGQKNGIGQQLMCVACTSTRSSGKVYVSADDLSSAVPDETEIQRRIDALCMRSGITPPREPTPDHIVGGGGNCQPYGLTSWERIFSRRQLLSLLAFVAAVRDADSMWLRAATDDRAKAVVTVLAALVDRLADFSSTLCVWNCLGWGESTAHTFGRQALPMSWDFAEINPFSVATAGWTNAIDRVCSAAATVNFDNPATVMRGCATALPWPTGHFDCVITDPPYYDNVGYAILSDYFYVWLKRSVSHLYPDHFGAELTPKRSEAIADPSRSGGSKAQARLAYEQSMAAVLREANRVLKPGGETAIVYAHKTTLGWSTLVEALRSSGFTVVEAWPIDTEKPGRLQSNNVAALASSIFLIARKRAAGVAVGNYEDDVQPELLQIVRERVGTLWDMGIAGADLVIACVGAGLRAFTKYERVEYANGEEVPAEKFLAEVEGVVLDTMMGKLFGQASATVSSIDAPSRFYILWRFVYKATEIEAGEAIVFTYAQHVELDGPLGLSTGKDALVEKKKANYRARDYTERGDNDKLGLPGDDGQPAPLIDVLHRVLWQMENSPRKLREFLSESSPDRERLRILAQALAGAALSGKSEEDAERLVGTTPAERAALGKLLANWRSLIEDAVVSEAEKSDRKAGQKRLDLK